ncbi:MAG TPA: AarF/UbiB family protein [Polyangiaceae bacterium]|nr:AarF/UbiB family protein [Polyangiaceae bacterium]
MLRQLRALLLFWTVFASYGFEWLLSRVLSEAVVRRRMEHAHRKNARRLAEGFSRLRGVFIKMGQVLSVMGTFLPSAYGEELEKLQDKVPPRPFREVELRLTEAFGEAALSRFGSFEETPIAAASLAQVHRATTRAGEVLAVKILYPGIEQLIRRDLSVLRSLLPVVRRLLPISRVERNLDQLEAMLARETDYAHERANILQMKGTFANRQDIIVPTVIDELTAGGVLTMSFETGLKVTDTAAQREQGIDPEAVARLLVDAYFVMLFDHGIFHADPHPGNFLVRPGPKLVVLDYGAVENVTPALSDGMKMVVLGALTRNDDQILMGLERMGFVAQGGDRELLSRVGREYLKVLSGIQIQDFSKIDRQMVEKLSGYQQIRGKLREIMRSVEYPEGYFYVERTLALLFGLVAQLAPKAGLPGLVLPHASKVFARGFAKPSPAANPEVPPAAGAPPTR